MNTVEGLKAFFNTPLALFGLMIVASLVNGLKQVAVAKQTGKGMTFAEYWGHVPETLAAVLGNGVAFILLITQNQLNIASAVAIGYSVNSLADFIPKGRSFALKSTPDDPDKVSKP